MDRCVPAALRAAACALVLLAGAARAAPAAVLADSLVLRSSGRAPIAAGRADRAFQRALDAAFRSAVLEALRAVAPDQQSPRDLEAWQETLLPRAAEFVGAWRILAQRTDGDFLHLEAEVEIWGGKLARAARSSPAAAPAARAVRLLVLAEPFPLLDPSAEEEVDAGRAAAAALEAELARHGAVIVSAGAGAPWLEGSGIGSEEHRAGLAAAEGRRLEADAVAILLLSSRGGRLALSAELLATGSQSTLATARAEAALGPDAPLAAALAASARQLAATLAPRLPAARPPKSPEPGP